MRLLIVEDDEALAAGLAEVLARRGYLSDRAGGLVDAELSLAAVRYAAVLLDLGLPDGDGLALLRRLRAGKQAVPVIVMTAREAVADRIAGLDAGADDYIVKPFDADELAARIAAVLRRPGSYVGGEQRLGNMVFDTATGDLAIDDRPVVLSARERQLAGLLFRRPGQVVAKRLAEDQLFGLGEPVGSNAVEVYAHRLRRKLEQGGADARIETVRGVGYLLRAGAP
jgi:two-component system response regulator TctD